MTTTGHCNSHTEYTSSCFSCYLSQPCDDDLCNEVATNSGVGVRTEKHGKWCPRHTNYNKYARALND
jgi:hypothetical protein